MSKAIFKEVRCAIYTRKSDQSGLEQAFNSIESQRAECEKFFDTNKQDGWILLTKRYDDAGFSGGNLNRPGLRELLYDIEIGKVNYVIIFKLNRLTRSLVDFIRVISGRFDRNRVGFRSVMEPYLNEESTDNEFMLHLNLGIAQRERKAVGDHLKIKIQGSKERGLWMGGNVPLGYDAKEKKLIVNEKEARVIKHIFARFIELRSMAGLAKELNSGGYLTKRHQSKSGKVYGGELFKKATVRRIITNPIYIGKVRHYEKHYKGEHKGIIEEEQWNKAQALIESRPHCAAKYEEAPFKGMIRCRMCNISMVPTYTKNRNKHYRYYACNNHIRVKGCASSNRIIAAGEIERQVIRQVKYVLQNSQQALEKSGFKGPSNLMELSEMWENLFPVKQQEIIKQLIRTIWVHENGIELCIGLDGLQRVCYVHGKEGKSTTVTDMEVKNGEISLFVPLELRKKAGRCMIFVPESEGGKTDSKLLKAVVSAHLWQRQLKEGKYATLKELSSEDKRAKNPQRILRLNFLSPKIKEDILNGKQPSHLKWTNLKKDKIPLLWSEQLKEFYER